MKISKADLKSVFYMRIYSLIQEYKEATVTHRSKRKKEMSVLENSGAEEGKEWHMSVDLSNSTLKIFRDESDKYFTYLVGNIYNIESKQTEGKFYTKRKIKFANNDDVKNKSKIKVLDGFASPYRFKAKNEDGSYKHINGEMYYIRSFELIEDGVDEKQKPFAPRQPKTQAKKVSNEDKLNPFSFNEYSGVTPF